MPGLVSVRMLQALLGTAYAILAGVAMVRAPNPMVLLVAAGAVLLSYMTARTIPDAFVSLDAVFGTSAVAVAFIGIGAVADAMGSPHALEWVAIVMAYCAGNRLRAAGIGPAR